MISKSELFSDQTANYIHIRDAEAVYFIARIERGENLLSERNIKSVN